MMNRTYRRPREDVSTIPGSPRLFFPVPAAFPGRVGDEPRWALRKIDDRQMADVYRRMHSKLKETDGGGYFLVCRTCGHVITSSAKKMEIAAGHTHTFRNPAGIVYRIGCFSSAPGCYIFGEPTAEYTWFPGYSWCYANCEKCFMHLGWFFQSGGSRFYGLILTNLVKERMGEGDDGGPD